MLDKRPQCVCVCEMEIMLRHCFYDCRERNMEPFDGLEAAPGCMLQSMQLSLAIEVSTSSTLKKGKNSRRNGEP